MRPRAAALRLERRRTLPDGTGDRFAGYGLAGLAFESGDVLAFRRISASSVGPPFTSVWHRDAAGAWTIHTNIDPLRACPRYFGPALQAAEMDDVTIRWTDDVSLCVRVRRARIELALRLRTSLAGTVLGLGTRLLHPWWLSRSAHLAGRTPSGHCYTYQPRFAWHVTAAAALLHGRDPGGVMESGRSLTMANVDIAAASIVVLGTATFQPPEHRTVIPDLHRPVGREPYTP
jgi:hypothetical protein